MRILPCGPRARLVEHDDPAGYAAAVREASADGRLIGIRDVIPAEQTVLVLLGDAALDADLAALHPRSSGTTGEGGTLEIPVVYDGVDLQEVASLTGLSVDEVARAHADREYRVAFCGFAPGFAYLTGIDPRLQVPRRDTPRTRVPAGSVAIAAGYSAVYPSESPGGWHLIGRTDTVVFDALRDEPALLAPGTVVRFRPVAELAGAQRRTPIDAHRPGVDAVVEVLDPGPLTLIEDLGRPGHGPIAVGTSGAFDRRAHRLAQRIVGNDESAAALEALGGGLALRARQHCVAAVTGASGPVTVDEQPVDRGTPLSLGPGQVLRLGAPESGLRSTVSFRGGIAATAVLGSKSRDTLAGLGPAPLESGDALALGTSSGEIVVDHVPVDAHAFEVLLRVHPGPRRERFLRSSLDHLARSTFTVSTHSDRVGVRLEGPALESLPGLPRLASEGMVRGAVQVPPDGHPVVLGPDHPVTGGYPVIAVVDDSDVDLLAQARPGTPVRFALVGW